MSGEPYVAYERNMSKKSYRVVKPNTWSVLFVYSESVLKFITIGRLQRGELKEMLPQHHKLVGLGGYVCHKFRTFIHRLILTPWIIPHLCQVAATKPSMTPSNMPPCLPCISPCIATHLASESQLTTKYSTMCFTRYISFSSKDQFNSTHLQTKQSATRLAAHIAIVLTS